MGKVFSFSLESNRNIDKNRSTSCVGGFWEIYTPERTCSELPSPFPGVDKFCTKGEFNSCLTFSPSMSTIIRLAKICKRANVMNKKVSKTVNLVEFQDLEKRNLCKDTNEGQIYPKSISVTYP
jgi:hypothetical protein